MNKNALNLGLTLFLSLAFTCGYSQFLEVPRFNYYAGTRAGMVSDLLNTGHGNAYVGYEAGQSSTGFYNVFLGSLAGHQNTTAGNNVYIGAHSGQKNKLGKYNTFTGSFTGARGSGSYNSFFGAYVGDYSTSSNNSFFGSEAGFSNTSGESNSFFGRQAGYMNTNGHRNVFIGSLAGYQNTSGSYNIFIGYQAGIYNSIGVSNNFLGYQAGHRNTFGLSNNFIGYQAGYFNNTGNFNNFIGDGAGYRNSSGSNNNFFGRRSGANNITGSQNIFSGNESGRLNTTGKYNSYYGNNAGFRNKTGNGNAAFGYNSGQSLDTLDNATAIGFRAYVSLSNSMVLGSIQDVNGATTNTNVGIGTTSPGYMLHVNGKAAKPGGGPWTAASDLRLKSNIEEFTEGMTIINQMRPIKFQYNGKAGMPRNKEYIGVIAQEMQKIAPYAVGEFTYQDTRGQRETYLDYDATSLTYIMVNALKEQSREIEALKIELEELKQLVRGQASPQNNLLGRLWQNIPNPYTERTMIRYQLPEATKSAFIKIYNTMGQELQSFGIGGKPQGEISISAGHLSAGTYIYTLVVNGKQVDTKKMVLTK